MSDFMRSMVRGFVWKMRMTNGAVFDWWTPSSQAKRKEAARNLLAFANDCGWIENSLPAYYPEDVLAVWRTKGVRSND